MRRTEDRIEDRLGREEVEEEDGKERGGGIEEWEIDQKNRGEEGKKIDGNDGR